MSRRTERIRQGAAVGAVGAVSAFAIEAIVRRVPSLAENTITRVALRLAIGAGGAALADSADASDSVTAGIFAGPVFSSILDVGGTLLRPSRDLGAPAATSTRAAPMGTRVPMSMPTPAPMGMSIPMPTPAQMQDIVQKTEAEMARRDALPADRFVGNVAGR